MSNKYPYVIVLSLAFLLLIGAPGYFINSNQIKLKDNLEEVPTYAILEDGSFSLSLGKFKANMVPIFSLTNVAGDLDFIAIQELKKSFFLGQVVESEAFDSKLKILQIKLKNKGVKIIGALNSTNLYLLKNKKIQSKNLGRLQPKDLQSVLDLSSLKSDCYNQIKIGSKLTVCEEIDFELPIALEYFQNENGVIDLYIISTEAKNSLRTLYQDQLRISYSSAMQGIVPTRRPSLRRETPKLRTNQSRFKALGSFIVSLNQTEDLGQDTLETTDLKPPKPDSNNLNQSGTILSASTTTSLDRSFYEDPSPTPSPSPSPSTSPSPAPSTSPSPSASPTCSLDITEAPVSALEGEENIKFILTYSPADYSVDSASGEVAVDPEGTNPVNIARDTNMTIEVDENASQDGTINFKPVTDHKWYGVAEDQLCWKQSGQSSYKITFKANLSGSDGSTCQPETTHTMKIGLKEELNAKAGATIGGVVLDSLIENTTNTYSKCCYSINDSSEPLFPKNGLVEGVDEIKHQYKEIIQEEEDRHLQQFMGGVQWNEGGVGNEPTNNRFYDQLNKRKHCSYGSIAGDKPQRPANCSTALNSARKDVVGTYYKVIKQFNTWRDKIENECWREKTAKEYIELTKDKAGFHLECAYPYCDPNQTMPPFWDGK